MNETLSGEQVAPKVTPQNGAPDCCCHSPNRPCPHDHKGSHVHLCLPRGLDLGGHCPDSGCPGRCWEGDQRNTSEGADS